MAITFQPAEGVRIQPAEWEARATATRAGLAADGVPADDLPSVLRTLRLADDSGRWWVYDGTTWQTWDGQAWVAGVPEGPLGVQAFSLEFEADLEAAPRPAVLETPESRLEETPAPAPPRPA